MKRSDFDKILFDALNEFSLSDFFENTRIERKVRKDEFVSGIKLSYELLSSYVDILYKYEEEGKSEKDIEFDPPSFRFVYPLDFDYEVSNCPVIITPSNSFLSVDREVMAKLRNDIEKYSNDIEESNVNGSESLKKEINIPNCKELLSELSEYIEGIDSSAFSFLIKNKSLNNNFPKPNWKGSPADAYRFIDHIGMTRPNFNANFELKDHPKGLITHHRQMVRVSKDKKKSKINDILNKYLPK